MRRLLTVLILSACCAVARKPLLPQPREIHYNGGSLSIANLAIQSSNPEDRFAAEQLSKTLSIPLAQASGPAIVFTRDRAGTPESYSLTIKPTGATLRAADSAGIFYGVQTLIQLADNGTLPAVEIRDQPDLRYRGFMMDLSHGQLLKVSEIERQIDLLARFKANQYFFYSEGAIELDGFRLLNPEGRYTQQQIRHIIDYGRQRHVEIVPCLELYGHLHDLFRIERYAALSLPRYGGEFDPRNPQVFEVLDRLVDQTTSLFPSQWVHIGFDEPWALGHIGAEAGKDPFVRYIEILRHVAERAATHNKHVLFWADMLSGARIFSNHPELISQLPKGTIAVPWVYHAREDYTPYVEPLAKAGVPSVVAPGVWNWNEIFPDYHRSFKNINGLLATGKQYKTLGMLNTGWTDSAQTIYRMSWPGLALGAVAAWQSAPVDARTFFADYTRLTYPAAVAPDVATALEELSSAEEIFTTVLEGGTIHGLWADPLASNRLAKMEKQEEQIRKARLLAESADEHLQSALRNHGDPQTLDSLLLGARIFDYLGMKNLYAIEWARYFRELRESPNPELFQLYINQQMFAQDHGMIADLVDAATTLRDRYREAWLTESTSYRLGSALARWDAEVTYWRSLTPPPRNQTPFPALETIRPHR